MYPVMYLPCSTPRINFCFITEAKDQNPVYLLDSLVVNSQFLKSWILSIALVLLGFPMQMPKELDIQLVSPWAMQQLLLPILPTCTLEQILLFKQVILLAHLTKFPVPPPAGQFHHTPLLPIHTRLLSTPCEVPTPSRALTHSKARTTHSLFTQHPLTSSTTPQWYSPTACRQQCTLLPSLHLEAMGSQWAWLLGPLWPCQQVPCWLLIPLLLSLLIPSLCPRTGLQEHPPTATCPLSGDHPANVWDWSCAVTSRRFHSWCCRPCASNQDFLLNALDT